MWKMLGLLVVGLAVGAGVMLYKHSGAGTESLLVAGGDAQGMDVQKSLAALDRRVRELTLQVRSLEESAGKPAAPGAGATAANGDRRQDWQQFRQGGGARTPEEIAAMRERVQKAEEDRIKAAGLTPERMQDINRRAEALRVAAMQAQYEAQRTGQKVENTNVDQALRKELGDAEYERYLQASGRPTDVRVTEVLATSAAERSGLKAGDQIVSYGGTRVFDARDLNALATQGAATGSVTVEVMRDGQTVQVTVPRGPLGVNTGGGGGRGPGGGGPPGGPGGGGFGGFRGGGGGGGGRQAAQ